MYDKVIDVWDLETFDPKLILMLAAEADTIRRYMVRDHEIFVAHDLGREPERSILRPDNAQAGTFMALKDRLSAELQTRTIRAWELGDSAFIYLINALSPKFSDQRRRRSGPISTVAITMLCCYVCS